MKDLPKRRRKFKELEKYVEAEKSRINYSWTNESVHTGVSGNKDKISLSEKESNNFLKGLIDYGFLDFVQYTSHSLCQMSMVLFSIKDPMRHKIFDE